MRPKSPAGTRIVMVTPSAEFEAQVRQALNGEFPGERSWEPGAAHLDARDAVGRLVPEGTTVVVLGPGLETVHALELARQVDVQRPGACVVLVAPATAHLWEEALRAGVREVITPGADDEAVRNAIVSASRSASRRATAAITHQAPDAPRARVVTVISSKGGSGKTTVAANLAIGLARQSPERVVLIDLDLQFGDIPTSLQLRPHATIASLTKEKLPVAATAMKALLEHHASGLYVLCAPETPAEADEVTVELVGEALDRLTAEFDFVVIDTSAGLDEFTLAAVDRSTDVILVGATDVPTVKGLRKVVDVLDQLEMVATRHFLLNRSDARVGLGLPEIESAVGLAVDVAVPSTRTIPVSLNQGSPVLESSPRSPAAYAFSELVARIGGRVAAEAVPARERRSGSGWLWGRRD